MVHGLILNSNPKCVRVPKKFLWTYNSDFDFVMLSIKKCIKIRLNTAYNGLWRFVLGYPFLTHHCTMYDALKWPSLNVSRHIHWLLLVFHNFVIEQCLSLPLITFLATLPQTYSRHDSVRKLSQRVCWSSCWWQRPVCHPGFTIMSFGW